MAKKNVKKVVGLERHDYISEKSGKPVKGYTLHCSFDDDSVQGIGVATHYVSDANLKSFDIANGADLYGRTIRVITGYKGSVSFIQVIE